MDKEQQIAAIKAGLAAVNAAIAQTEAALRSAANLDDIRSLNVALVDLRSERSRLQAQLDNLEAASVEVQAPDLAPAAKASKAVAAKDKKIRVIHKQLNETLSDRTVVEATLKLATDVHGRAKSLRELMSKD